MDRAENRIGTISSFDPVTGMASIIYNDRDGDVTQMLPFATFNGEYKRPEPGTKVLVAHLSNGNEMGIILGTYWNESNPAGSPGIYHKDLGKGASFDFDGETLEIKAGHITLSAASDNESFTVAGIMEDIKAIKERLGMA